MKNLQIRVVGTAPLIMHSDRTANVFDNITKELKNLTSKRKKTDDDLHEIAELEFIAGAYYRGNEKELYTPKSAGATNGWYMPAANILATLKNAGKNFKLGKRFEQSVNILTDPKFLFKHDKLHPAELFKQGDYTDIRTVKVGQQKISRTRPIFEEWEFECEIWYEEIMIDEHQLDQILDFAGKFIGLCDYRPRFGRFETEKIK